MALVGWKKLLAGWPWFQGEGHYPLEAYSEFLPPPRLGRKPYGSPEPLPLIEGDPSGWQVTEYEEAFELRPGLEVVARQLVGSLAKLGGGHRAHGISRNKLEGNPYWPDELARRAGKLPHERYFTLLPLALSRTQDDKGRIRWTVFGNSAQGPARAFWRSFFKAPGRELPEEDGLAFVRRLLQTVYDEPEEQLANLRRAGFRILPLDDHLDFPFWREEPLPGWTEQYLWGLGEKVKTVKYLLTFRPFGLLPEEVRRAYLAGELHLLPCPMSLVFWGAPPYRQLYQELPLALQVPLLHLLGRHEGPRGLRIPQGGWLHEPREGVPGPDRQHGPMRNTFKRTHRWGKVHRHEDELEKIEKEEKLTRVLFSTAPDDLGLYGKPMARNAQLWTHDSRLLLDGPHAGRADLQHALEAVDQGGLFGYRFLYPAMRVGRHEVYWYRPLVAYRNARTGRTEVLPDAPLGYLAAYDADNPDLAHPVELWPRLLRRPPHLAAIELTDDNVLHHPYQSSLNVRKLLDTQQLLGPGPLPRSLARALLTVSKEETLDHWLERLPGRSRDREQGQVLSKELGQRLEPGDRPLPEALTYHRTASRPFEVNYWKTIALLAEGKYLTKNNADCVRDPVTQRVLTHRDRDLDALGAYLLQYYTRVVRDAGLAGKALVGDLPFRWQTDFTYEWMGGWLSNQEGPGAERDLIVVIPGRDRRRAVIMADHYDTAYMADHYEPQYGGNLARLAASGADDNHSATAALMLGAPLFLELSKAGQLDCDIWLIHLTGEEFPADCLGARHLTQCLVEGTLKMRLPQGKEKDLSGTRVQGLYVLDMVAHNNDRDRDVFQIAPGTGLEAMWLAWQAHLATEIWNAGTTQWNKRPARKGRGRARRSPHGAAIPETAEHLALFGEVRPPYDPRSTLYNTDGQIFSDAGVPAVLFMENYDINRSGYHDSKDTMENIDLDYGAALAAIAIEAVARAASGAPGPV
jgi:hypothetical protein